MCSRMFAYIKARNGPAITSNKKERRLVQPPLKPLIYQDMTTHYVFKPSVHECVNLSVQMCMFTMPLCTLVHKCCNERELARGEGEGSTVKVVEMREGGRSPGTRKE